QRMVSQSPSDNTHFILHSRHLEQNQKHLYKQFQRIGIWRTSRRNGNTEKFDSCSRQIETNKMEHKTIANAQKHTHFAAATSRHTNQSCKKSMLFTYPKRISKFFFHP